MTLHLPLPHRFARRLAGATALACVLAACGAGTGATPPSPAPEESGPGEPAAIQPGAPGEASRTLDAAERAISPRAAHTEADVRFMQNMILHHAQAIRMSRMAPDRASGDDIRLLARRIDRSQGDEIALMERWLQARGEEAPEWREHLGHHAGSPHEMPGHSDDALMAGMLTQEQFEELAAAEGEAFDRLFLQRMIMHHDGALEMVSELFSMPGAAQDSEIFQFASHVDGDQRIEIARMQRMLRGIR